MKMFSLLLLVFFSLFFAGYKMGRHREELQAWIRSPRTKEILDWGFQPVQYAIQNRPFVIVVIAQNDGASVEKALDSIFSQKYDSFRLIYVDDASNDGSAEHARALIERSGHLAQTIFVQNEAQLGMAANLLRAAQSCESEEIIVAMRGSGRLAHEWVLDRLNHYYADPDLWLVYGQYMELPQYQLGRNRPFSARVWEESGVRGHPIVASQFSAFYASLFKKIEPADLMYNGQWISSLEDFFYLAPLFEMAKGHFQFIPDILYLTPLSEKGNPEMEKKIEKHIRGQTAYHPLAGLPPDRVEGAL